MLESEKVLQERYRVQRQIGQGGMGSVYLATDERFGSTVAIKETLIGDAKYKKAFEREARLLNTLKHTALPKVSDHFTEETGQYIVMEYITGSDLYEMMAAAGSAFPISDVRVWAEQLLDALEYLHNQENPIIHRDIKPQNLKLTTHGQIVLLDFGLAKGNPTDANHQTAAHSIFGYSRNYASLEQIQGTGTDPRSDIYSLAATLYHLATGKPPADALTRVMMVMNEEEDPLQPPHLIHEQVDEGFSGAIMRSMSLNANLRPQTVGEMYESLFGERKTVVTQKTKTGSAESIATGLSTQNTKVFPPDKGETGVRQSEVRTEVMPSAFSSGEIAPPNLTEAETVVRTDPRTRGGGIITQSFSSRRRKYAAVSLVVLGFVGSVLSMVYLFESTATVPELKDGLETFSAKPLVDSEKESALKDEAAGGAEPAETEARSRPAQPEKRKQEQTRTETATGRGTGPEKPAAKEPGLVEVAPGEMAFDEMLMLEKELKKDLKVVDGKVETEHMIIDDKGIVLKDPLKPDAPRRRFPITREEFRQLTPAQRKRLRNILEMQRRINRRRVRDPRAVNPRQPPTPPENRQ